MTVDKDSIIVDGQSDELLCKASVLLSLQCANYYPNKTIAMAKWTDADEKCPDAMLAYSQKVLSQLDGVFLHSVTEKDGIREFELTVNGEKRKVKIIL